MVGCFGIAFDDFCLSWIWLEFLRFATLDCVEGVCKTEPYPGVDLFCFHTKCCRLIVWLNCCPLRRRRLMLKLHRVLAIALLLEQNLLGGLLNLNFLVALLQCLV